MELVEVDRTIACPLVVENVAGVLAHDVGPVRRELPLRKRLRPRCQLARIRAAVPALAKAMLDREDAIRPPILEEGDQDPSVTHGLAIRVRGAFPRTYRGEVGRRIVLCGDVPRGVGVIRNAEHPDLV